MDSHKLLKTHQLLDIITVADTHYALSSTRQNIPECTCILVEQLPTYLPLFLKEGFSERFKKPYSETIGLSRWTLYSYGLEQLPAGKKQAFSHALSGTGGRAGLLAKWHGRKIGRSAFMAPSEQAEEIASFFAAWHVQYTSEVVLRG